MRGGEGKRREEKRREWWNKNKVGKERNTRDGGRSRQTRFAVGNVAHGL